MTLDQKIVFAILLGSLILFVVGLWRYDIVALLALLAVTLAGILPPENAFSGFGHPAVITVAAVLVVSRGLMNSGVVDAITRLLSKVGANRTVQVASLTAVVMILSAFMNNVGALALMLPVAVRMARQNNRSPSFLLMPIAFGSLLGGMTTLIGTPPNIIISNFRNQTADAPFRMFDFSPVGVGVAVAGLAFVALIGWRLIPQRQGQSSPEDLFQIKDYIAEVAVPEGSKFIDKALYELETIKDVEVTILGLTRGSQRVFAPQKFEILRSGDVLIVQADSDSLKSLVDIAGLQLGQSKPEAKDILGSDEVGVMEVIVTPDSPLEGNTAWSFQLRWRYGINLLGVARGGARLRARLRDIQLKAGDILLLQGPIDSLVQALPSLGCLPLAERGLRLGQPRRVFLAVGIFAMALAAVTASILPVQIAFCAAAVAMVVVGLISLRDAYSSIEWPIIVLLGAMIPVGSALESTGAAKLVAEALVAVSASMSPVVVLIVLLIVTMFLSDLINNAAAAIIMAPIGIGIALAVGASADPFLMSVAVGASCAFLTPVGHQSNAMVLAPGGYRFGDYWRMGLVLELLIVAVSIPLILRFWPLYQ